RRSTITDAVAVHRLFRCFRLRASGKILKIVALAKTTGAGIICRRKENGRHLGRTTWSLVRRRAVFCSPAFFLVLLAFPPLRSSPTRRPRRNRFRRVRP